MAGDPFAEWVARRERGGRRVTLLDLYELAAAARGTGPSALTAAERAELGRRALPVLEPGWQPVDIDNGPRADPVEVVPYDPGWPAAYQRWRSRLAAALGPAAVRIEHVGSTAVTGLVAKPVIDVQVSVPDPEDEPAYAEAVASTGVPLRARAPGHRLFRPPPGRPRDVHVHVCAAGGEWEREHLLFRDYLRAHPAARDRYATAKTGLAAAHRDDRLAYTEAKTGVVLDLLEAAAAWATRTGWSVPAGGSVAPTAP